MTRRRLVALDLLAASVLAALAVADNHGRPWPAVVAAAWAGSLALRTVSPTGMALTTALLEALYGLAPQSPDRQPFLATLLICFSIGLALRGRRLGVAVAAVVLGGVAMEVALGAGDVALLLVSPAVLVGAPVAAGALLRRTRARTAEVRRISAQVAAERESLARAAEAEERTRLARELHDLISHSVSLMLVQAGAAEQLLDPGSVARAQVRELRRTGKEALLELRRQLGVLREEPTP